jgi:hypothetical protein
MRTTGSIRFFSNGGYNLADLSDGTAVTAPKLG